MADDFDFILSLMTGGDIGNGSSVSSGIRQLVGCVTTSSASGALSERRCCLRHHRRRGETDPLDEDGDVLSLFLLCLNMVLVAL